MTLVFRYGHGKAPQGYKRNGVFTNRKGQMGILNSELDRERKQHADEIERLTAENERLRNVIAHIGRVYTPNGGLGKLCKEALADTAQEQTDE